MSKLNLGLGLVLVLGGFAGLAFQAWGLAGILLLIGTVTVLVEVRAHRRRISQTKQNAEVYEIGKAHAADYANPGGMLHQLGGF